jgi:hypothetical protein
VGLSKGRTPVQADPNGRGWSPWYLLLLIQFVAVLWVPFYNSAEPYLAGVPFFYWYQLLWVLIGAGLTAIVYFATE